MITKDNLEKVADEIFENITVKYIYDELGNYWGIYTPDPEEIDEDFLVAKLYDNEDLDLEIINNNSNNVYSIEEILDCEAREKNPEELLEFVIDDIKEYISKVIEFNEILIKYFK